MPPEDASSAVKLGDARRDVDVRVRLSRTPGAARDARHAVRERLGALLAEETLDDVLLVVSELVTNAVLYGDGEIELHMTFDGRRMTGEVTDGGAGFTRHLRPHGLGRIGGNGLDIVERIAERWGMLRGSSHVWFEVPGRRSS
jgi:anti-sigma regulatory factor (Ser/Thr protein kinase)